MFYEENKLLAHPILLLQAYDKSGNILSIEKATGNKTHNEIYSKNTAQRSTNKFKWSIKNTKLYIYIILQK